MIINLKCTDKDAQEKFKFVKKVKIFLYFKMKKKRKKINLITQRKLGFIIFVFYQGYKRKIVC